jgi:hypothetical protein
MEASVVTNLVIEKAASLEHRFHHDHRQLNTVYRVFASLLLDEQVATLTRVVAVKSPVAKNFSKDHAVNFLGDAMECSFRSASDPRNNRASLVEEFLEQWQISEERITPEEHDGEALAKSRMKVDSLSTEPQPEEVSVQHIVQMIDDLVKAEVPLHTDEPCPKTASGVSSKSHSWFPNLDYIGSNRAITHTIRLLQGLSSVVGAQRDAPVAPKDCGTDVSGTGEGGSTSRGGRWSGGFGTPLTRIQVDMDACFLEDIMPGLIDMCREGMFVFPFSDELLTAFGQINSFVTWPECGVSWSLAVTVHCILTAVFEVQGSNHFSFIAEVSRCAFQTYVGQQEATDRMHRTINLSLSTNWRKGRRGMFGVWYVVCTNVAGPNEQDSLSIWNPLCAGMLLSYIAYRGNFVDGSTLIDAVGQLRMTLHLFNALRQSQVLQPGQVEVTGSLTSLKIQEQYGKAHCLFKANF